MNWSENFSTIALLAASIACSLATIITWRRRPAAGAVALSVMLLAISTWSLVSLLPTLIDASEQLNLLIGLWVSGQTIVATLYLIFVLEYTQQDSILTRRQNLLVWIIPLLSIILIFGSRSPNTPWLDAGPGLITGPNQLLFASNPVFWLPITYFYLLRLMASVLLVRVILQYPATYRIHAAYLLIGAIITWLPEIVRLTPITRINSHDWGNILPPIAYAGNGLIITWGIFKPIRLGNFGSP